MPLTTPDISSSATPVESRLASTPTAAYSDVSLNALSRAAQGQGTTEVVTWYGYLVESRPTAMTGIPTYQGSMISGEPIITATSTWTGSEGESNPTSTLGVATTATTGPPGSPPSSSQDRTTTVSTELQVRSLSTSIQTSTYYGPISTTILISDPIITNPQGVPTTTEPLTLTEPGVMTLPTATSTNDEVHTDIWSTGVTVLGIAPRRPSNSRPRPRPMNPWSGSVETISTELMGSSIDFTAIVQTVTLPYLPANPGTTDTVTWGESILETVTVPPFPERLATTRTATWVESEQTVLTTTTFDVLYYDVFSTTIIESGWTKIDPQGTPISTNPLIFSESGMMTITTEGTLEMIYSSTFTDLRITSFPTALPTTLQTKVKRKGLGIHSLWSVDTIDQQSAIYKSTALWPTSDGKVITLRPSIFRSRL